MKIVLSIDEVGQIIANYLYATGKVKMGKVDLSWQFDSSKIQDSYVEVKQ